MTTAHLSNNFFFAWAGASRICRLLLVGILTAFVLTACSGAGARRSTYIEDLDGVKSRIESVQKELAPDFKKMEGAPARASAGQAEFKTLSRTGEALEFESEGEGFSTKYERPLEAEKRAEEDALAKAVKAAGVSVYAGIQNILQDSPGAGYEYIGKYLNVWSDALVSYERAAPAACALAGDTHRCTVKIRGKVYFTGSPDSDFKLKAELEKPAYFEGDNLSLLVKADKDAYITVLHCDEDGGVTLIFPNRYSRNNFLPAGSELEIPNERAFRLTVALPPGRAQAGEMLHVIATKGQPLVRPEALTEEQAGGYLRYSLGGLKELAVKLSRLERSAWTTQVLFYEVKKKPQ